MQSQMLGETLPFLSQFFLNPAGLLALAGLVPLLIFYLVRPEPEEKLMPSMMFFKKQESDSKLRNALRTLLSNLVLLLHVLIVAGFAVSAADPFINSMQRTDQTTVIVDRSASMQGKRAETIEFLDDNLGKKNTVILVDDEVEIKAEEASPQEVKDIVRGMKYQATETDIATGIQTGLNFQGELVIASDLDQTVDSRNIKEKLESTARPVTTMETETVNRWAITGMQIEDNTTEISVRSFQSENSSVEVKVNQRSREFTVSPGLNTLEIKHRSGRNTVKLPADNVKIDNRAYFFVPESGRIGVEMFGSSNRYFQKAVELIKQTEETVSTPANPPEIYALRENPVNLESEKIRSSVKSGSAAIVFPGSEAMQQVFDYGTDRSSHQSEVVITSPRRIDLGQVEYINRSIKSGKSLSDPPGAVKMYNYGKGKILAFNVDSQRFRENILYPVFWKEVILKISDKPTDEELNLQTGTNVNNATLQTPAGGKATGNVELVDPGFYTSGSTVYAANLLSADESAVESLDYQATGTEEKIQVDRSLQNLSIIILLLLMMLELSYLYYRGDI